MDTNVYYIAQLFFFVDYSYVRPVVLNFLFRLDAEVPKNFHFIIFRDTIIIIIIIIIISCVSQLQRCKMLVYSTEHQVATHNLRYPEHILGFSLFQEDRPFARFRSIC